MTDLARADARHMPLADASVDAIVCDPPYGLEFMGKEWDRLGDIGKTSHAGIDTEPGFKGFVLPSYSGSSNLKCATCGKWQWDYPERKCVCAVPDFPNVKAHQARIMQAWHEEWAREALRVLKPGGHLLAFGGTRTHHRLMVAIEDAGFEVRDVLMWLYGSGFPKSLDVSKAIDKAAGAERVLTRPGTVQRDGYGDDWDTGSSESRPRYDEPTTDDARRWEGWGTALKPAYEPIVLARKPLIGTVAANVQEHGTGGLNIDGTRIAGQPHAGGVHGVTIYGSDGRYEPGPNAPGNPAGRWPANLLLDEEAAALLDASTGNAGAGGQASGPTLSGGSTRNAMAGSFNGTDHEAPFYGDSGGPSRFFYTSKASRTEREAGLDDLDPQVSSVGNLDAAGRDPSNPKNYKGGSRKRVEAGLSGTIPRRNDHPTVKPVDLMRWLVTLITPRGGTVLDPFMGSGSTGVAAVELGFNFIGFDLDAHYVEIARRRMAHERPMRMAL